MIPIFWSFWSNLERMAFKFGENEEEELPEAESVPEEAAEPEEEPVSRPEETLPPEEFSIPSESRQVVTAGGIV